MGDSIDLSSIWDSSSTLLGFQVAAIGVRLGRELELFQANPNAKMWLTPSDSLNLVGIFITVFGIYIAPLLNGSLKFVKAAHGVSMILTGMFPILTMGHYDLLPWGATGHRTLTPDGLIKRVSIQENNVIRFTLWVEIFYIIIYLLKNINIRDYNDRFTLCWTSLFFIYLPLLGLPCPSPKDLEYGRYVCLGNILNPYIICIISLLITFLTLLYKNTDLSILSFRPRELMSTLF